MNNMLRYALGLLTGILSFTLCLAQADSTGKRPDSTDMHRQIAIFAPLYLDSAFDANGNYRYDKTFPKFINPGLEFYEGAQLALDSLQQERAPLDVRIYDTRSASQNLTQVLQSAEFQRTGLILGHVGSGEMQQLAIAAAHLNIPFINVNYPNDGGITNNPDAGHIELDLYETHCEGIYRAFSKEITPPNPFFFFRKKGSQEDRLKNYFMEIEKTTASVPLKIKNTLRWKIISMRTRWRRILDSSIQTICIAGSLDENFGKLLCQGLSSLNKTYPSVIIGMPTWDNIADFVLPEYCR